MVVTREQIESKTCFDCGIDEPKHEHEPLYIHAQCHVGAPLEAEYRYGGTLILRCHECKSEVVTVAIQGAST